MRRGPVAFVSACAQARGFESRLLGWLTGALLAALGAAQLNIYLMDQAGSNSSVDVLNNASVVGISLPICVLARTLQNRLALFWAVAPRHAWPERLVWVLVLVAGTMLIGAFGTLLVSAQQRSTMIIDCVLLLWLAILAAVLLGAEFSWTLPMAAAVVCTTPGLIAIDDNVLMNAGARPTAVWLLIILGAISVASYVALDDYTIGRRRRLLGRLPAVTDD